ncbi:Uncharacterized protein PCOAH_00002000 [Plasmodium coatneyi]|uniref:Guanylate cyclase domain-containing protein n=1 Tax=Plasmodium coatneyi TaxID=208452 RepID=A0A1B1DTD6_9APIC|nr:Uncharacterized protein PCOAH_00002000 [Plasmodium coatneyi]ANQ05867.1 Uncharacterized protein PCOAH_00002000 [Plasmodium coatneyi]
MIKNIFSEYLKSHEVRRTDHEALTKVARDYKNNYTSDWRWFSIKCERIIENELQKKSLREEDRKAYSSWVKEAQNLSTFRSFFPKILLKVYSRCDDPNKFFSKLVIQKFDAVVVGTEMTRKRRGNSAMRERPIKANRVTRFFCDASGFSNLAEQLDKRINGTELLGNCLNKFFNILIKIIDCWGGDIIKFSGDAVLVIWPLRRGHRGGATSNMKESPNGAKPDSRTNPPEATEFPPTSIVTGDQTQSKDNSDYYPSDTAPPNGDRRDGTRKPNQKERNVRKICLLALGCCVDIHKLLNKFPTPIENKYLKVHIAITYGKVSFLQLGNVLNKRDYLLSGKPLEEIGVAESLARNGESVISHRFYEKVKEKIVVKETPKKKFFLFERMKEEIDMRELKREYEEEDEWEVPTGELSKNVSKEVSREGSKEVSKNVSREMSKNASREVSTQPLDTWGTRRASRYDLKETPLAHEHFCFLLKSFIPDIVYRKISTGCNVFVNEIRKVTIIFLSVKDIDTSTMIGVYSAHGIMKLTQKAVFTMEGTINKFIYDDKGILILIMFGLPPLYHCDDSVRALLTCFRLIDALKSLKLNGSIGISTGRIWCGIIGNKIRKEYTALGDSVNVAARLCCKAGNKEIYVDENTFNGCKHFISFQKLISIKVKGKNKLIRIYSPIGTINRRSPEFGLEQGGAHGYFTDEELQAGVEEVVEDGETQKGIDKKTPRGSDIDKRTHRESRSDRYTQRGSVSDRCTHRESGSDRCTQRGSGSDKCTKRGSSLGAQREGHTVTDAADATKTADMTENTEVDEVTDFSFLNRNYLLRYYERTFRRRIKQLLGKKDCLYYLKQCEGGDDTTWQAVREVTYRVDPYNQLKTTTPLDYNTHTGPLLLHEYYDPLYCDFTQLYNTGGVLFLQGNEHLGIFELITLMSRKLSNFKTFRISNMPHSLYINVTNPLLPWKMLCNDMLQLWSACKMRKANTLIRCEDNYNLLREITYPSYHWFFKCMSSVVDDLVVPYLGQPSKKEKTTLRSKRMGEALLSTQQSTEKDTDVGTGDPTDELTGADAPQQGKGRSKKKKKKKKKKKNNDSSSGSDRKDRSKQSTRRNKQKGKLCRRILTTIDHFFSRSTRERGRRNAAFPHPGNKAETQSPPQIVAQTDGHTDGYICNRGPPPGSYPIAEAYPLFKTDAKDNRIGIISSMLYYFTLHEYTFIVFNYRAGTSLNVMGDESALGICKNIAKLAMYKRGKILKSIQRGVKHWRRNHCRGCNYCKGVTHLGGGHLCEGSDDPGLVTPSDSADWVQGDRSSGSTHTQGGKQSSHEEQNRTPSSRNSEGEPESRDHMHSDFHTDCGDNAHEDTTPSEGQRHINKSANLGDINIAQMFREERAKKTQGLNRRFYKTLFPDINDNILLYVAEQKMRERSEGRDPIQGEAGNSPMGVLTKTVAYDTGEVALVEKQLTRRTLYSTQGKKSPLCDPVFKGKHKPLIFLFVNGMKNDAIKIRAIQEIKKCAQQCNGYLKLEELNRERLCDFVGLCLRVKKDELNKELVDYLYKTCFGIPKFVQYTLFYLLTKKYIKLYRYACRFKETEPVGKAPNQGETSIGFSATEEHSQNSGFPSNPGKGPLHKEHFSPVGSTTNADSTSVNDPTSYTYINEATKQIITHQNGFRNFQFCDDTGSDHNGSNYSGNDSQDEQLSSNRDPPSVAHLQGKRIIQTEHPPIHLSTFYAHLKHRFCQTAHCMSLIDSLNQEELLLAKLCSFFKQKFNIKKMECIFPRYISRSELKRIIKELIRKSVFQVCEDNGANQIQTEDVNSIHNINFVYRDIYNLINDVTARRQKHHSVFRRNSAIPDEALFFCIMNFSLKKVTKEEQHNEIKLPEGVLNDLLENEEKKYIQKIYKKYLDESRERAMFIYTSVSISLFEAVQTGNFSLNESGEFAPLRQNSVAKLQTHEMENEGATNLPTFSEAPEISSKIYDNILELDSRTEAGNSVRSRGNYTEASARGEVQVDVEAYPSSHEVNGESHSNKNDGVDEEQSMGEPQDNHTALSNQNFDSLRMAARRGSMQDLIQDTHKNTLEHKQTNFLCLEEILKKTDLILQLQMKMSQSVASHREERQLLFQHLYELKKQVADKAFNSLCNKDLARQFIEWAQAKQKKDIPPYKTELTCVELQREKYNPTQSCDVATKGTKNTRLFFFHLSELEECVYSFTHFCRDMSTRICPPPEGGYNTHSDSFDQGFFSFLRDPQAMQLIRGLEKNLTKIKSMCMQS